VSGSFLFDNIKPTLTISNPSVNKARQGDTVTYTITLGEGTTFDNSKVVLSGTATSGASVIVIGSGTTRTATVTVGTGDGTLGINVNANAIIDAAGNGSNQVNGPLFTVDNTAPNVTVSINSGAEQTRGVGVLLTITNSGDPAWMYISNTSSVNISGVTWIPYNEKYLWEVDTRDGDKTVYVWAKDDVGNYTTTPKTDTILLNAIYISSSDETTVKFKATDNNYHVANIVVSNITVKRGGQAIASAYKNLHTAISITKGIQYMLDVGAVSGDGQVSLEVTAGNVQDKAGNLNNISDIQTQIIVDNTAPVINISNSGNLIFIECTDASEIAGALLNGIYVPLTEDSGKMIGNYTVSGPGTYSVKIMDRAGNVATSSSITI
jgi:hypothetical protein